MSDGSIFVPVGVSYASTSTASKRLKPHGSFELVCVLHAEVQTRLLPPLLNQLCKDLVFINIAQTFPLGKIKKTLLV
jgi:hypothetical protein